MNAAVLSDVTTLPRIGMKGPNAAAWLAQHGVAIPAQSNSWCAIAADESDIIARLGSSEFLIEAANQPALIDQLGVELRAPVAGVYPVLREDRAFVLSGAAADDVLAEVCNVNFSALPLEEREAVMTMMIGVAVTVVPQGSAAQRRYRIWCDPSYGDYLWSSLLDVARPYSNEDLRHRGGIR